MSVWKLKGGRIMFSGKKEKAPQYCFITGLSNASQIQPMNLKGLH